MQPELTDGWLTLRPPSLDDSEIHFEAVSESLPELQVWLPWAGPTYDRLESRRWIKACRDLWQRAGEEGVHLEFHVFESGRFVGACSITPTPGNRSEIGYWVRTADAGRGICTAAVRLISGFGFAALGMKELLIKADPQNLASQAVARKAGAIERPDHEVHLHDDGSTHELIVFVVPAPI